MPKSRKTENKFTTISIGWGDKLIMRHFASFIKETKNGQLYESDAVVFKKILIYYDKSHQGDKAHSTYPTLRDEHQQG